MKRGIIKDDQEERNNKRWLAFLIIGLVCLIGGLSCFLFVLFKPAKQTAYLVFPNIPSKAGEDNVYSSLTGELLENPTDLAAPTYCIQTPNGTDGARPQVGLDQAGVIFEAIAEAGITRFAAIYQNPSSAVIGPIRSLRLYYLEWDTPFDCTIVHAGGADDALAAVRSGGYKDLTENYTYMYRGNNKSRLWNNLFTTATELKRFSIDHGYGSSDIKGFARMTPEESKKVRVDNLVEEKLIITKPSKASTSTITPRTVAVSISFGNAPAYNVDYNYDATTNTYKRSYGNGNTHQVYSCPSEDLGERNPEDVCTLAQMSPNVVVAMVVSEKKASDNYHEDITAIGSGTVYIFQNGTATKGTWKKLSREEQIRFYDETGSEVKLAPGQTFISAVPNYGSVEY